MRIFVRNLNACMEVIFATQKDKTLYFIDADNNCLRTNEYSHEDVARSVLGDLVLNGFLRVEDLYYEEEEVVEI